MDSVRALEGVKVLDLSRVLAGPWATQTLGDLGADVVKVERPNAGDDTRKWGPPWIRDPAARELDDAAYFTCANRNKRSIAVDLATAEGQDLIRRLAAKADVLVENFKVGGLKQYGLDFEAVRKVNPRLVYCSITGFGQAGPYAERPGYDFLIQGMGGLMSITGHPDATAGGGPMKVGVAMIDVMSGLYAVVGILAALRHRDASGEGQHIDIALLDVQVSALANQAANYLVGGQVPERMGNAHPNIVPYQDFPTADGHMILTIGNDGQFKRFCDAAGRSGWSADSRFGTNAARVRHRDELVALMRAVTSTRSTQDWISLLEGADVPCGPINDVAQVFANPHVKQRGLQLRVPHPSAGEVAVVASPLRLSATPVSYRRGPPELGAHTVEAVGEWLEEESGA